MKIYNSSQIIYLLYCLDICIDTCCMNYHFFLIKCNKDYQGTIEASNVISYDTVRYHAVMSANRNLWWIRNRSQICDLLHSVCTSLIHHRFLISQISPTKMSPTTMIVLFSYTSISQSPGCHVDRFWKNGLWEAQLKRVLIISFGYQLEYICWYLGKGAHRIYDVMCI